MNIVDIAIYPVICQESNFHGNFEIQNSQKLDPLQIPSKKFQNKICQPFKNILVQEIDPSCITKSRIRYNYAIWLL
jgi:hypothetical protein